MRIGLLGELEVHGDDGRTITVSGAKQRALLAVLALQVGRVVPTEQLVEALWGDDPPSAVRNGLQGLASKLRRSLGSPDLVAMRSGGYVLDLPAGAVDVHRHEELVAAGQAAAAGGDLSQAAALLAEAGELWRGDPLADFTYEDFATTAIARLNELRLTVLEERLDLELRLGRHQGAVVQLEELVTAHPLRERLRGLLMLALYRAGRQAEALRVFQEGRQILGEELGLEPGHELRALESAILTQDRSLDTLAAPDPDPVARPDRRSTIPVSLTALIGRTDELRDLAALLALHRFVTLVGPGGVGKTRLALEVGRAAAAELTFGGCLVELAPVGDPAGVRAAIASALDLPDPGRLAELIGEREVLIVLDNCEHVITAAAEVAEDLLRSCPNLRLLATSREGLRVGGETIWAVPPLAAEDAVQLFVARAQASGSPIEPASGDLGAVADVCVRLDGLPLAIELAAARTRAFPITEIAKRLDDRFRLLTGGSRTALPRQQTLRAVVDWSYELLFDAEQRVFERLSVFPGGCDLATAEAVCADDTIGADDLPDLIHALVEKSLVLAVPSGDGLRFTQLQTLAEYGREKLAERGEAGRLRDAMARHFAMLCAESPAAYIGDRQRAWLTAIDQEQDNLRAALEWAVTNDDADTALTIAGGASWPHWLAGTLVEGRRWLDAAFACGGTPTASARGLGLTGRGLLEFLTGATQRADADLEESLAIATAEDDLPARCLAHSFYAELAAVRGDLVEARRRRSELLAFYADLPDEPFFVAARVFSEAKLASLDGDLDAAERHYRESAALFAQIDRPVMLSITLGMVADFDERSGDYPAAARALEQAIQTNDAVGLRGFIGSLHARLGGVLLHDGDLVRAEATYERAHDGARRLKNTPVMLLALAGMSVVHLLHGRDAAAEAAATEALELHLAGGPRRFRNRVDPDSDMLEGVAACCSVLGARAADTGAWERSARLLGHAERLCGGADGLTRAMPPSLHLPVERARDAAVVALGHDGFEEAFAIGRQGELGVEVLFTR
jgi:predicted ATPase/DNA-binding SARP family transcriptional activator